MMLMPIDELKELLKHIDQLWRQTEAALTLSESAFLSGAMILLSLFR